MGEENHFIKIQFPKSGHAGLQREGSVIEAYAEYINSPIWLAIGLDANDYTHIQTIQWEWIHVVMWSCPYNYEI